MGFINRKTQSNEEKHNIEAGIYAGMTPQNTLPTVALRGLTILPGMVIHFDLNREKSITAVEQAMLGDQRLLVVTQKNAGEEEPAFADMYDVGTVSVI